jgi:hypothetical protein
MRVRQSFRVGVSCPARLSRWSASCLTSALLAIAWSGPGAAQSSGDLVDLTSLQLPQWELQADLRLGSRSGHDAFVRILNIHESLGGELLIVDAGLPGAWVFDADGSFIRQIGRRGEGPGEFTSPVASGIFRDTLWVADQRRSRVATFTLSGEVIDDRSYGEARHLMGGGMVPIHRLPGGGYLAVAPLGPDILNVPRYRRPSYERHLLRLASDLTVADTLFSYTAEAGMISMGGGGLLSFSMFYDGPITIIGPEGRPITIERRAARNNVRFAEFRITARSASGATMRSFRYKPAPVPTSVRDSIIDAVTAQSRRMGRTAAENDQLLRAIDLPPNQPPIRLAHLAPDGSLWLQREELAETTRWLVLGPDLSPLANVSAPRGLQPRLYAIDADAVWVVEKDELDVQSAVRYRILKPR